jgi:type II secretory pathway component GspD/PulD (secretin)
MKPSRFSSRAWLTFGFALLLAVDVLAQTRAAQTPTRSTATPNRATQTQARPTSGGGGGGGGANASNRQYNNSTMVGDAMITSDVESRRLIIVTDDETNENIKTVIASLDKPKPQVLINVVFLQVTHDKDLDLGTEASYTGRLAVKNNPKATRSRSSASPAR